MKTPPSISRNQLAIGAIIVLLMIPVFLAGRLTTGHFDYESCVESAASVSNEESTFSNLVDNCGKQYVGRRSDRGGYVYTHPKYEFSAELEGPNPTPSEWEAIDAEVAIIIDNNRQKEIERADRIREAREQEQKRERAIEEARFELAAKELAARTKLEQCTADANNRWDTRVLWAKQAFEERGIMWAKPNYNGLIYFGTDFFLRVENPTNLKLLSWELSYTFLPNSLMEAYRERNEDFACPAVLSRQKMGPMPALQSKGDVITRVKATMDDSPFQDPVIGLCYHAKAISFERPKSYMPNC